MAGVWFISVSSLEGFCVVFPDLPPGSSGPSSQGSCHHFVRVPDCCM